MPNETEPHILVNGVRVPWPASGLLIEFPPHPAGDAAEHGPVRLVVQGMERPVRVRGVAWGLNDGAAVGMIVEHPPNEIGAVFEAARGTPAPAMVTPRQVSRTVQEFM